MLVLDGTARLDGTAGSRPQRGAAAGLAGVSTKWHRAAGPRPHRSVHERHQHAVQERILPRQQPRGAPVLPARLVVVGPVGGRDGGDLS
jgi:hypothetical protein